MATLYKQTPTASWTMRYRDEHGREVRKSTRTRNHNAAQMVLNDELRAVELRRLRIAAPSPMQARTPIADVVARHLADALAEGISPAWVRQKRYRLDKVIAWTGVRTIGEITPELVRGLLGQQLAGMKTETRKQYLSILRELCEWAIDQRPPMLAGNPVVGVMPRRRRRARLEHADREERRCLWTYEIPMLLSARPEHPVAARNWDRHRRPLYIVAMRTGLRRGTLERITPSMVRLDCANPRMEIPPGIMKSRRAFVMPLVGEQVIENVEHLLRKCSARKPFAKGRPNRWSDRPFGPVPNCERTFAGDLERAGIPLVDEQLRRVVFHSLRATFATQLALAGVPPLVTMELMDHTNIATTQRYYQMVGVDASRRFMGQLPSFEEAVGRMPTSMTAG